MDREKVIKGLEQFKSDFKPFCGNSADWERVDSAIAMLKEQDKRIGVLQRAIERMPQPVKLLDVYGDGYARIVRCKDCKHRDPEDCKCDCGHDIHWQLPRPDEWFCADGERR